jgi:hypothetical protein
MMLLHAHMAALACNIGKHGKAHACCTAVFLELSPAVTSGAAIRPRAASRRRPRATAVLATGGRAATPVAILRYVTVLSSATYAMCCPPAMLSRAGSGAHKQHQAHRL